MRTIIDLPEKAIQALDAMSAKLNLSRAELVRRSVSAYLERQNASASPITNDIYGLYHDLYDKNADSLDIQNALRREWDEAPSSINAGFTLQNSAETVYDE